MRRVLILGSPGSGKSTFARALAAQTGLPLIHLDQLYWRPNWTEAPPAEWRAQLEAVLAQDAWIIDGNYGSTLAMRLKRADTAILLDFPRWLCMARTLRRVALGWGRVRPDMAAGCPEHFDLELLRFIWSFSKRQRPALLKALGEFAGETMVLRSAEEVRRVLADLAMRRET